MENLSFIHNRRGITVVVAVLAMIVLAGFGCGEQKTPAAGAPAASSDGSPTLPTEWTTYRNEEWGIAIPYPDGWYVERSADGQLLEIYDRQPPPNSDMPARVWVRVVEQAPDQARVELPAIFEESSIRRNGRSVLRVVHQRDVELAADEPARLAYLWTFGSGSLIVDGELGDIVVEEIVDRLTHAGGVP